MRSLKEGRLSDISKYGGFNSLSTAYFFIVKFKEKNKEKIQIISLPVIDMKKIKNKDDLKNYCINTLGMEDPIILVEKLRKNTKISYEGHKYRITGKDSGGLKFILNNDVELYLENDKVSDLYHILLYLNKYNKISNKYLKDKKLIFASEEEKELFEKTEYKIRKYKKKHLEEYTLNDIYLLLKEKCETIYKNMKYNLKDIFINSENQFYNLSFYEKSFVIKEALKLLNTTAETPNFENLGFDKKSGRIRISYIIDNKKIYIHNESVTGIFENKKRIK